MTAPSTPSPSTGAGPIDVRDQPADPTKPIDAEQSLGELVSRMTSDISDLFSTQLQLAKVEIKEELTTAGKGAGMLGGGAIAAYFSLLLVSLAVVWGLAEAMPGWVAFLIVGLVYAAVAAVLYAKGREQISSVKPVAEQTTASLKEDAEWARQLKS
jgi:uncharacterized membrane protein YqjE